MHRIIGAIGNVFSRPITVRKGSGVSRHIGQWSTFLNQVIPFFEQSVRILFFWYADGSGDELPIGTVSIGLNKRLLEIR